MPDPRLVPLADFSKGVSQAPGFMRRAQGAAEEMVNLTIDLQGRPIVRKGYSRVDTNVLSIGTEAGEYRQGDQLAVTHWLGDSDTPNGIKRIYYLPREVSWVQDEQGRLLFIASQNAMPQFIDVKENIAYDWTLPTPPQLSIEFTRMMHGSQDLHQLSNQRNVNEMRLGNTEIISYFNFVRISGTEAIYVDLIAETDVGEVEVFIEKDQPPIIGDFDDRLLFAGPLEQGSYRWYWDAHAPDATAAESGDYRVVLKVEETDGKQRILPGDDDDVFKREFEVGDNANQVISEDFSVVNQIRFICMTYANKDLQIESRPGPIFERGVYRVLSNSRNLDVSFSVEFDEPHVSAPAWATHIYVYVSIEAVPLDYDYTKAVETGFDFRRIFERAETGSGFVINTAAIPPLNAPILDSYDHDEPVEGFHSMGAYGVGLWGAARNRVYFNKIGNQGEQRLYALPSANALVPHSFPLSKSGQSPILHVHPAAHESALLAFKRDAIHIIRGKGVISGLYDPETPVEVDIDASGVIVGTGTSSPRSVLTVGSAVYFVGSDRRFYQYGHNWQGQSELKDVGLPIQKYLNEISDGDLDNLVAFLYQNCYHLIMPERVIVLDMTRKYWASFSWRLKDAFWSRGGINSESILYGIRQDGTILSLYDGDADAGVKIGGLWRSNPVAMPSESVITGIIAVHTDREPLKVKCRADIDDREGNVREYTPRATNHFRCGMHKIGSRVTVQLETDVGFPLLDRVQAEIYPR